MTTENKRPPNIISHYMQPSFLICVVTLGIALVGMTALIKIINPYFIKHALPLRKSLDEIDRDAIKPYKVVNERKITNKDVLESLGTEEYIQWEMMNTDEPAGSSTRYCSLFITYYTGNPDQVPHVPEECYTGGGSQSLNTPEDIELNGVPARCLTFGSKSSNLWSAETKFNVFYLFKVNGHLAGNRDKARFFLQTNFASRYSYFSKVEWKFYNMTGLGVVYASRSEAKEASAKLISTILPILENQHWPDWEKANLEVRN